MQLNEFKNTLRAGILRDCKENVAWCSIVGSQNNSVQTAINTAVELGEARREAQIYGYSGRVQTREVKRFEFALVLAGMFVGGLLIRSRLPYIGATIGLAGPVFCLGAWVRVRLCDRASRAATERVAGLADRLEDELGLIDLQQIPLYNQQLRPPEDLAAEVKAGQGPAIWDGAHPHIQRAILFVTVMKLAASILEVGGYTQMGGLLNAIRGVGIVSILGSSAINGLYDTGSTWKERALRAVVFSALLAIAGCRAYQGLTGLTFGDYEMAWKVISKGEYYGYLIWKEAVAGWSLIKVMRSIAKYEEAGEQHTNQSTTDSAISVSGASDFEKHLSMAKRMEMDVKKRETGWATARGLLELVRPGLRLAGVIAATGFLHHTLRLSEAVVGLWTIYLVRCRLDSVRSRTVEHVYDDRLARYGYPHEPQATGYPTPQKILNDHLRELGVRDFSQIPKILAREERRRLSTTSQTQ